MSDDLDALKSDPGVLRIYGSILKLRNAGGGKHVGLCPFHAESSPSFTIFADMRAHCFGCQVDMNVYQFLERTQNIPFKEAVERVKKELGKSGSWEKARETTEKTFKPIADAKVYKTIPLGTFQKLEDALAASVPAREWLLKERGITYETAKALHLGFAQSIGNLAGPDGADIASGGWIAFPSISNGQVVGLKYRSIIRKKPGGFARQPGMATSLFNEETIDCFEPVMLTEGECFSGDTEVSTPQGWVRLDQYEGQKVAQWEVDGSAEYVVPFAFIEKEYTGPMHSFQSRGDNHFRKPIVDLLVTPGHRMVYLRAVENEIQRGVRVSLAKDMPKTGFRMFRACHLSCQGIDWSENEIRLQVMIQADASMESLAEYKGTGGNGLDGWIAEFKKERKISRFRALLEKMDIPFTVYPSAAKDTVRFRFNTPPGQYKKVLPLCFYQMNTEQRAIFLDEVPYWDGTRYLGTGSFKFNSTIEQNADVVQWACITSGLTARKYVEHRSAPKVDVYGVIWGGRTKRGHHLLSCGSVGHSQVEGFSGKVYCVNVPTGMLVVRRNGLVAVCGNCDTAVLEQAGYRAVSVPSAGVKLSPEQKDSLMKASFVVLAGDNDATGSGYMSALWKALADRTYLLTWPETCKDANETFLKHCGGDVKKFQAVVDELVGRAKSQPLPDIYSIQEVMQHGEDTSLSDRPDRLRFPWPEVDKAAILLPGSVLGVLATSTSMGKTAFALQYSLYGARKHNEVVVNWQCELSPAEISVMVAAQVLHKNRNFLTKEDLKLAADQLNGVSYYVGNNPSVNRIEDVLDVMEAAIRRLGATQAVLDNIHYYTSGADDDVRVLASALKRIKQIAVTYGVKFSVVFQPRKASQQSRGKKTQISDIKSSATAGDTCDAVVAIHRELAKSEAEDEKTDIYEEKSLIEWLKTRSKGVGKAATYISFLGEFAEFISLDTHHEEPE